MPTLVANCPRCGAQRHTFDVLAHVIRSDIPRHADWMRRAEAFSVCRNCLLPTIFLIELNNYSRRNEFVNANFWTKDHSLNQISEILRPITLRENISRKAPDHVPQEIAEAFSEGATCLATECFNAAGTMFRLCLDLATRALLPDVTPDGQQEAPGEPNRRQRRDLGLRLPWLIESGRLPADLGDFANVVREDGNDGAHVGNLTKEDAEDLADFAELLLERLYTEPARVELAKARRISRREGESGKQP